MYKLLYLTFFVFFFNKAYAQLPLIKKEAAATKKAAVSKKNISAKTTLVEKNRDSDGDGIIDNVDKCPDDYGPVTNGGCPLTDVNADSIRNEEILEKKALREQAAAERKEKADSLAAERRANEENAAAERKANEENAAAERKARADSIAMANELNKKYNQAIARGKLLLSKNGYNEALEAFETAKSLKPAEEEPLIAIDTINQKIIELNKIREIDSTFESLISIADSETISKSWNDAIESYTKALDLKPLESYPQKQIKYLQSEITRKQIEDSIIEKQRKEEEFNSAIKRADDEVKEKKYEKALDDYNKALNIHPEDEYAQSRAKIMLHQVNLLKEKIDKSENK